MTRFMWLPGSGEGMRNAGDGGNGADASRGRNAVIAELGGMTGRTRWASGARRQEVVEGGKGVGSRQLDFWST